MELTWNKRGEHGWEAWFGGVPQHGAVQVNLFEFGPSLNNDLSSSGGMNSEDQTLSAGFDPWIVPTREEAEARALRNGQRLQRWANGQGPEGIPALEWGNQNNEGCDELVAQVGRVSARIYCDGEPISLWATAECGEPETEDYLYAFYAKGSDSMLLGNFTFETVAEAQAFAQTAVAALCRWLGGDPDREEDSAQEALALD